MRLNDSAQEVEPQAGSGSTMLLRVVTPSSAFCRVPSKRGTQIVTEAFWKDLLDRLPHRRIGGIIDHPDDDRITTSRMIQNRIPNPRRSGGIIVLDVSAWSEKSGASFICASSSLNDLGNDFTLT